MGSHVLLLTMLLVPAALAYRYCHRPHFNCPGDNIRSANFDTVEECQNACSEEAACLSIQYYNGRCWLKRKVCQNNELRILRNRNDYVKLENSERCRAFMQPRTRYCKRQGMKCSGHNIVSIDWLTTVDECQDFCDWYDSCKSIQYNGDKCWLKRRACENSQLAPYPPGADYVKIPKDGNCREYRVDYKYKYCRRRHFHCPGNDIRSFTAGTVDECQDACSYQDACLSVQYYNGRCWLKRKACQNNEVNILKDRNDYVKIDKDESCRAYKLPRTRYCKREGMNCRGYVIVGLDWVTTANECQDFCDRYDSCKSIQFNGNKCWLRRHACENSQLAPYPAGADYVKIPVTARCRQYRVDLQYRYCERPGFVCTGRDIYNRTTDSLDYCQQLCGFKDDCVSFQFVNNRCYLKNYQCKQSELTPGQNFRDFIKIDRSLKCQTEIPKLDE